MTKIDLKETGLWWSKKDREEADKIMKYTKGTRMDDAYYFFTKPKENSEKDKDDTT